MEPIPSNSPEQDDAYQKGQDISNCWEVPFFTIHLSALLLSQMRVPFTDSGCQHEQKDWGNCGAQYDSAKNRKDL